MLTIRRRGKAQIFYIRGSVTLGSRCIDVPEFSTGTSDEDAAAFLKRQREAELIEELMFGPRATVARATIADAFDAYLTKPNRPGSSDVIRIGIMNEHVGQLRLSSPEDAWNTFQRSYLPGHAAAGQDRYRSVFQAAINVFHEQRGLQKIKIKTIPFKNLRVRFLSRADRDRLIASYAKHVQPIIITYAYQGCRTQEGLQLKWGAEGVNLIDRTIWFDRTKSGEPRMAPMHPIVEAALINLWEARGRPTSGHVFLNQHGEPYQDTRDAPIQGGNPLKSVHKTACRRAAIPDFTVHDWRHHWASHCVMAGIDLETIKQLGGWASLRMVERYAAVSTAHMVQKLALLT
jgi:integrase